MSAYEIVELTPQPAAVMCGNVRIDQLPEFFGKAFTAVMAVVPAQGIAVVGPPFGFYPSMPGETVEVRAGFPTSGPVAPTGDVVAMTLPGGRAVQTMHIGPYDTLQQTYGALMEWIAAQGLELADQMWEVYLSDPSAEPDPSTWRTQIVWPLVTR